MIIFITIGFAVFALGVAQGASPVPSYSPTPSPSQANWKATPLPFKLNDPFSGKRMTGSYNGQIVAIANQYGIYASTDYGNTFFWTNAAIGLWPTIVSDSSGNNMYALNYDGILYFSYGSIETGWAEVPDIDGEYIDIATDSSGSYLYGLETGSGYYCSIDIYKNQNFYNEYFFQSIGCDKIFVDSSNTYILVMGYVDNKIAVSTDSGLKFTIYDLPFSIRAFYPVVTTSYTDKNNYVYIANNGHNIEISTNRGASFTSSTTVNTNFRNASMIACSGSGETVVFGGLPYLNTTNAEIWISSNYGSTFTTAFPTTSNSIDGGFVSSSGTSIYVIAGEYLYSYQSTPESPMPTYTPTAPPTTQWYSTPITTSTNFGFSAIAVSNNASCVTIGATDGATLFARQSITGAFTEWNSGVVSSSPFSSVSMSLDGQYQIAVNGMTSIFISNNSGLSWAINNLNYNGAGWKYSAMSSNGNIIMLSQESTATFALYVGINLGVWSPAFTVGQPMIGISIAGIAVDNDGSTLACMSTSGIVFVSRNQGVLWIEKSVFYTFSTAAIAISSANFMTVVAAVSGINLLQSSVDQGYTFTTVTGPGAPTNVWTSLASSYSGQYIIGSMEHGQYDTSTSQEGIYYSQDHGLTWEFIYPMQHALVASNPAGNYLLAVSNDVGSTQLYYSTPIVPTMSPTLFSPTLQPTSTNAPFSPINKPITGWVLRSQYAASGSSCTGSPLAVTGFMTGTCLISVGNPNVLSVMYSCDSDSIVMTEYSDATCVNQLSSSKSYFNGQQYDNEYNQCVTQLTCVAASSMTSTIPLFVTYNIVEYSNDCVTPITYQALQNLQCINTDNEFAIETGIYSVMSVCCNELYEYSELNCGGSITYRSVEYSCTSINSYINLLESSSVLYPYHIDTSSSITKDYNILRSLNQLIHKNNIEIESITPETSSYGFGSDDIIGGYYISSAAIYHTSNDDSDGNDDNSSSTSLSSGDIVGIVIGSLFGFAVVCTIIAIVFNNINKSIVNNNKPISENQVCNQQQPHSPQPMPVNQSGVMMSVVSNTGMVPMQPPPGSIVYVMGPNNTLTPMMVPQQQGQGTMLYTTNNPMLVMPMVHNGNGMVPVVSAMPMMVQPNQSFDSNVVPTATVIVDEENNALEKDAEFEPLILSGL